MTEESQLAIQYHVLEKGDNPFQRRARILQSMWRVEQGFAIGEHSGPKGKRLLGSRLAMPWAQTSLANFLNETIRQVVREEVLNSNKRAGKLYAVPRLYSDLLSSQPLCFNLFGELQQNLALASRIFCDLLPEHVEQVTAIEFEFSPGRSTAKYTADQSAFDVYVAFRTLQGERGFVGIEVKYHEDLKDQAAAHRPRYDEIAELMNFFKPDRLAQLKQRPLQQIWRDHLLAGSLRHVDHFEVGFFAVLYPEGNLNCASAVRAYRDCLADGASFITWTLEDFSATVKRHTQAPWIDTFIDRYLNFGKLGSSLATLHGA
jgi:hypothetical protein